MSEPRRKLSVFVVDDEEIIASTLAMILRLQGFNARSFNEPMKALQAAKMEAPDLLISDVVMPLLSGIELAIQIREYCPDCKILLFSGQASTGHLLETAKAIGHDFDLMTKPVHPTDLLIRVRRVTEESAGAAKSGHN